MQIIYEVVTIEDIWGLKQSDSSTFPANFETKEEAIDEGRRLCRRSRPSRLIVRLRDGSIEQEFDYGRDASLN